VWPADIAANRFATTISNAPQGCNVAIIGLADDLGVRLNNGRPGATLGPLAFRAALGKYGALDPMAGTLPKVFDAGDIVPAQGTTEASLHETHARVTQAVSAILKLGLFPIAVGGGHDLSFPFIRAVAQHGSGPLECVLADAHLDVRETVGSGMPFRRLLEAGHITALHARGTDPFANSREHAEYVHAKGGSIDAKPTPPAMSRPAVLSIDLDVLDCAHAPGVSAVNPSGWSVRELEDFVRACAGFPHVRAMDIMELSPPRDSPNASTARVAAHIFLTMLRALSLHTPGSR
jgi:arginase family enzyme